MTLGRCHPERSEGSDFEIELLLTGHMSDDVEHF
jgi:hypothetical protein